MKKLIKTILLVAAFLLINDAYSQKQSMGDKLFASFSYPEAIEAYESELQISNRREGFISQRIAESYRLIGDYANALAWYQKVVTFKGVDPIDYFYYARMLESNGQPDSAQVWFKKYVELLPQDSRAKEHKNYSSDKIVELLTDDGNYRVSPVNINTEHDEFSPSFIGKKVAFVSNRIKETEVIKRKHVWNDKPFLDIYIADREEDNDLIDPNPFQDFNASYHEGPSTFTRDGKRIYFTRQASRGNSLLKGSNKTVGLMIFTARKVTLNSGEEKWTDPEALDFNSTEYTCMHPTVTGDGQKLYFASDQAGGYGGMDLYMCDKTILGWSKPVNLGPEINTSGDEVFPFITAKGDIYFASNGHLGVGGLDVFRAKKVKDGGFKNPTNLGFPINTQMDDFGFILDVNETDGYFSSNRKGGAGRDDIYRVKVIEPIEEEPQDSIVEVEDPINPQLEIFVYDKVTGLGLDGAVVNIFTSKGELVNAIQTNDTGFFRTDRSNYSGELRFITSYTDYSSNRKVVVVENLPEDKARINLPLSKDLGKVLNINPIYFDYNKANIRADAAIELDKIVRIMKENPSMVIEVASHTDCRGEGPYNYDLSNRRAKSSREYIISRGIDASRVYGQGYGETQLTNQCEDGVYCSEPAHQLNRRTEFRIVKF
mgnify:CR=1 FL=1|tara:strand:+ start:7459 stop:9426 length:1968 start_codon:yes stop_codon:yes gene_type:complete